jgi:hypothetical protein
MRVFWPLQIVGLAAIGIALAHAQGPPPIHGVTGTIATEGTIEKEYKAANKIIVATKDGVEHIYDAAKDLVVHDHGGNKPLADLKPGTTVVIHYTDNNTVEEVDLVGPGGLNTTEGIATKIDPGKSEITIRYYDGKIEKLRLTDRAADEAGKTIGPDTRVVVYYSNEAGRKVTHYCKKLE